MAEALGVAASVIAVLQLSARIISACDFYLEARQDMPTIVRSIRIEVNSLRGILEDCDLGGNRSTSELAALPSLQRLAGLDSPIEGCRHTLDELQQLVKCDAASISGSRRKRLSAFFWLLRWPLKEDKARKLLQDVAHYKATISVVQNSQTLVAFSRVEKKTAYIKDNLSDAEKDRILGWLVEVDPSSLHNQACNNYEDGTGSWMLKCPEWRSWLDFKTPLLWFHGIPGSGKTYLMSHLIEQTKQESYGKSKDESGRPVGFVYYYCHHSRNHDETVPLLRWILSQLCRQADYVPHSIRELFREGTLPRATALLECLGDMLEGFRSVRIFIDALDESTKPRTGLLASLKSIATEARFQKIGLVVASREHEDIKQSFRGIASAVSMSNQMVTADIKLYVRNKLEKTWEFNHWPGTLLNEVETTIATKAQGMFRYAACQIEAIRPLPTSREVERALEILPDTLDETYERVLAAVPPQCRRFTRNILMLLCAPRLGVHEIELFFGNPQTLVEAAILAPGTESSSQGTILFNERVMKETLGCLISVPDPPETFSFDVIGYPTFRDIRIAHFTVKEYLLSDRIASGPMSYFAVSLDECGTALLDTSLSKVLDFAGSPSPMTLSLAIALMMIRNCEFWEEFLKRPNSKALRKKLYTAVDPWEPHYNTIQRAQPSRFLQEHIRRYYGQSDDFLVDFVEIPKRRWTGLFLNILATGCDIIDVFIQDHEGFDCEEFLKDTCTLSHYCSIDFGSQDVITPLDILSSVPWSLYLDRLLDHVSIEPTTLMFGILIKEHYVHYPVGSASIYRLEPLLGAEFDYDARSYRVTPLQMAAFSYWHGWIKFLLEHGADPNYTGNPEGRVPFEKVVFIRKTKSGSDTTGFSPGFVGMRPLSILRRRMECMREPYGYPKKCKKILLRYGADEGGVAADGWVGDPQVDWKAQGPVEES
ncbi:hypothetical protein DL764_000527 [Monosporascus ibericus]|uniref:Nephrocystin 3-like N-terminal domain-containing protein n=1 Tax=Monosporascus ibericus TaxID=155417 RepID=A0A4Q4TYC6_9PEZI|nr:hypothetical protein DL764_000527 [Monosporascus ibericus]